MLQEPRVQLISGLNRTKQIPTSVPTTRPQNSNVSCAAGPARPGGGVLRSFRGCPISRSITTYCVCPELRPLPSTGITRLQRYYEPLRHPSAPGLALAGFQLVVAPTTPWGFPCCVRFLLCTCCRHYPGAAAERTRLLIHRHQPSPKGGRVGLRIVLFEDCSAFTRVTACASRCHLIVTRIPKAEATSLPPWLPGCFRLEHLAGWDSHQLESAAFSRRTPAADSCGQRR